MRELEEEVRQLDVSLLAREGDVAACDREMEALSARLKGETREKEVAAVTAAAEADELRGAVKAIAGEIEDGNSDYADETCRRCGVVC